MNSKFQAPVIQNGSAHLYYQIPMAKAVIQQFQTFSRTYATIDFQRVLYSNRARSSETFTSQLNDVSASLCRRNPTTTRGRGDRNHINTCNEDILYRFVN
ncbi:Protein of unknown function [Pyronema omphalodes CBS 100304]|uniref:Uncharacterized protein n=1 Tax=Pyronema omphalodes (strain CBS 100304) TaxID=1076935 RepID=U4KWA2_PYROM|nr:Protein of unknown function [Pyronema omphalodes CBS 100304]